MEEMVFVCQGDDRARAKNTSGLSVNQFAEYRLLIGQAMMDGEEADADTIKAFKANALPDGVTLEKHGKKYIVKADGVKQRLIDLYDKLFSELTIVDVFGEKHTGAADVFAAIDAGNVDYAVSSFVIQLPVSLREARQGLGKPIRGASMRT